MQDRRLFLIPVGLSAENGCDWVGAQLRESVLHLRRFVVEHPKSARQFLKGLGLPLQELEVEVLDEHSKPLISNGWPAGWVQAAIPDCFPKRAVPQSLTPAPIWSVVLTSWAFEWSRSWAHRPLCWRSWLPD